MEGNMHCTAGGLQGCCCPWGVRSHLDTVQACRAKESSHKLLLPGTKDVSYSLPGKPCCGQSMCCCLRGLLNLRLLFAWGYPCARPALGAELQFRTFLTLSLVPSQRCQPDCQVFSKNRSYISGQRDPDAHLASGK